MSPLSNAQIESLVQRAVEVRDQAYAPHSRFLVGAAILVLDDHGEFIHRGCNVENASYGLTLCAERVAASAAVSHGHRSWRAMALATIGGVTPCGACRQFLAEFEPNLTIILADVTDDSRRRVSLQTLLPDGFGRGDLPIR